MLNSTLNERGIASGMRDPAKKGLQIARFRDRRMHWVIAGLATGRQNLHVAARVARRRLYQASQIIGGQMK